MAGGTVSGRIRGVAQWALGPLVVKIRAGGETPESAAWAMGVGMAVGTVPLPGAALPAAVLLASVFGLSQAVTNASMLLAAPLQLLMLTPYVQIGLSMPYFQGEATAQERIQELKDIMGSGMGAVFSNLGALRGALAAGVAAWVALLPALCCFGYLMALPIARRIVGRKGPAANAAAADPAAAEGEPHLEDKKSR